MNVLELQGPQFLAFFVRAVIAALVAALALRWTLRLVLRATVTEIPMAQLTSLRPFEVAYLAGGLERALQAVVSALAQRKLVEVDAGERTIRVTSAPPDDADPVEKHVQTIFGGLPRSIEDAASAARPLFEPLRKKLTRLGLLASGEERRMTGTAPAAVLGAVLLLGIVKIGVGLSRDKPVSYLVVLCIVAAGLTIWMVRNTPERSVAGDRAIERLRERNAALEQTTTIRMQYVAPEDIALAVGLYGVSVIRLGALADLETALQKKPRSLSGGGDGGGGSCGGGCGGGCGGCGG